MNVDVVVAVVFTILIVLLIVSVVGMCVVLFLYKRSTVNNIDILIYELSKTGFQIRYEKGRFQYDSKYGKCLYTANKMPHSIKDKLGYNFTDNDICPSKNGLFGRRYFIAVAAKDSLFSALQPKNIPKKLKLSPEEQKTFKDISAKLMYPVNLSENPESLSLTPILGEQIRFKLDVTQDAQDVYMSGDKEFAKTLIKLAIMFSFGVLIFAGVVIIVIITQGGSLASSVSSFAASAPLPPG